MASVMQKAIHIDEDASNAQHEYISRLQAENQGLRDLLLITNGNLGSRLVSEDSKSVKIKSINYALMHTNEPTQENSLNSNQVSSSNFDGLI